MEGNRDWSSLCERPRSVMIVTLGGPVAAELRNGMELPGKRN
jgi:hypothetical protein